MRQYLLVDDKKFRRNSAPEYLGNFRRSPYGSRVLDPSQERHYWLRASTSDLSVLLDNQSESGSSLELDTSNLSRELSPAPTPMGNDSESSSSHASYQSIPVIHFEVYRPTKDEYTAWNAYCSRFIWKIVLLSQALSICLTVMDESNKYIRTQNENVIGLCFANYILLSIFWTTRLALRNDERSFLQVLKLSGLRYVLLSVLHVEANYFLFSSFQKDSYMGNQMIDFVAASLALVLSYVCLDVQYQLSHVNGFMLSVVGAVGFSVANATSKTGQDEICWGDILRIGSGLFLALNNLAQELIVKSIDSVEYLGMIGFLGSFISGVQTVFLEDNKTLRLDSVYWFVVARFALVHLLFTCMAPCLLRDIGTTGLHLALLSSEFYSHVVSWFDFGNQFHFDFLQVFSYMSVLIGSYLFAVKRTSIGTHYFFPVKAVIPKGN